MTTHRTQFPCFACEDRNIGSRLVTKDNLNFACPKCGRALNAAELHLELEERIAGLYSDAQFLEDRAGELCGLQPIAEPA